MHRPVAVRKVKEEKSKYSSRYALSELLICRACGHPYCGQIWSKNGRKSAAWRCESRLKAGTKNSRIPTLKEIPLHEAIMKAVNRVVENQGEFVGAFREKVIRVIGSYSAKDVATEYDGQIEELQ